MFQREVAERLVAAPRSTAYGRLSVLVQWLCRAENPVRHPAARLRAAAQGDLERRAARPARRHRSAPADKATLERVTAAAFGQRRKMLRSSLKSLGVPVEPLLAGDRHRAAPRAPRNYR